jgi:hypothetical protein
LARVHAERILKQVDRRHPVEQGVVNLGVDGEASVVQPLDDMALPQRAVPVEHRGM